MNKSTKIIIWVVVVVIVVGGVWYIGSKEPAEKGAIKIGAIFALSGNAGQYGEWAKNAISLAVDEINSKGGVDGRLLEVIYEDNEGKTASAVSSYQKLSNVDGVQAVMTFLSSVALAIEPLANKDGIIQMDISATTPDYTTPNDYSFRTGIVATQLAEEAADILTNKLGANNVAILYINNDFGRGMLKTFKEFFEGNILLEESFNQDSSDFRTQLLKLKSIDNLDYIFLVGHLKEGGILIKQARQIGINTEFFSDVYSIEGSEFIKAAGDSAEGTIYVAPKFHVGDTSASVSSFVSVYQSKYEEDPNIFAAQSYDGLITMAKAFKNCSTGDNKCVRERLMKTNFEGASGLIKFDINGDVKKYIELKTVKNGEFVPYTD